MSTEARFWERLRDTEEVKDNPEVVAWKVQDAYNAGLPDACLRVGWVVAYLELKYVKEWPVRETTNVWVALSANQRQHLREWRGQLRLGLAYVLLGVDNEWFLLDVEELYRVAGDDRNSKGHPGLRRDELEAIALARGKIGDWQALLGCLYELGKDAYDRLEG